jgi:hypothetical protein
MREATALIRRVELTYPGRAKNENVIAGFRKQGQLALYFGADPVFQFDDRHRLRRAYGEGFLYRTQGHTLARLTRERTAEETLLLRHDLNTDELDEFRKSAKQQLNELHQALLSEEVRVIAEIPIETGTLSDIEIALAEILRQGMPLAPAISGKR